MSRPITDCGCPYDDRLCQGHNDRCPTLTALTWPDGTPKVAPVQGYVQGIPWSLHLEAYDDYRKRYGSQAALIDLDRRGCRGGFGTDELDKHVPGWRDRVGELAALRARIAIVRNETLEEVAAYFRAHPQKTWVEKGIIAAIDRIRGAE